MSQISALGGTEITRLSKAHNAVIVSIDAKKVPQLTKIAGVAGVRRVIDYQLVVVGDRAVHRRLGRAGLGHGRYRRARGGTRLGHRLHALQPRRPRHDRTSTTPATQAATRPRSATCASLFGAGAPKVVGGYDFVGEIWPGGDLAPDANPIDFAGHGTHVSDIIGGRSADGTHKGVAPGASLYGVKVCSAVATSCSGVAILQGIEFALDPNGDGDISDAVDVINLSLGSLLRPARGRLLGGDGQRLEVRRDGGRVGRQQRRPPVHRRLALHDARGDQRRADQRARRRSPTRSWSTRRRPSPACTRTPIRWTGRRSRPASPVTSFTPATSVRRSPALRSRRARWPARWHWSTAAPAPSASRCTTRPSQARSAC